MRIGIDISTVLNHGQDIGSGRYIINLIRNLLKIDRENTYVLTGRYITGEYLPIIYDLKSNHPENKIKLDLYHTTSGKLRLWNKFRFPAVEFLGFKADILHCPDYLIPPTLNRNIVLTIHDLAFIRFPEFNFDWFIKKYKINKKYIFSVGTIEPRKNFVVLIKAFNNIKQSKIGSGYKLVIVGRTGWKSEAAYQERENSPYREDILFTGRIPDQDLVQIYNQA